MLRAGRTAGHRTAGVLFGRAAAGAFIATGLVQDMLAAVPGGDPVVMDLPSIARVTKLPLERLEALSKDTPVFAPGLDDATPIGAVAEIWSDADIAAKLAMALDGQPGGLIDATRSAPSARAVLKPLSLPSASPKKPPLRLEPCRGG